MSLLNYICDIFVPYITHMHEYSSYSIVATQCTTRDSFNKDLVKRYDGWFVNNITHYTDGSYL